MKAHRTLSACVKVNTLWCVVRYVDATRKLRTATQIQVFCGLSGCGSESNILGDATIGGRWSQAQALAEFRKNPARFGWGTKAAPKPVPAVSSDLRINLGPAPVAAYNGADGVWTAAKALDFFKAEPGRFERLAGWDFAWGLKLISVTAEVA